VRYEPNVYEAHGPCFFFGGTFDPPHRGHREIVSSLLRREVKSSVILVPAASAPLRDDERLFAFRERFRLLRLLFEREIAAGRVILSSIERHLPRPSYTWNTLDALARHCDAKPTIVIGADQAAKLPHWHRIDELKSQYRFLCFSRKTEGLHALGDIEHEFVADFDEDISATQIREALMAFPARERFDQARKIALE
jgi:nicotinate-nucleotide adenylyltransferase